MENTIKQQQLDLFSDRTSASRFAANQLRLLFSAFASILFHALRRMLYGTRLARATAATLRLKPLKIGARVTVSVRRVKVAMDSPHTLGRRLRTGPRSMTRRASPPTPDFCLFPGTTAPQRQPGPFTQPRSCRSNSRRRPPSPFHQR